MFQPRACCMNTAPENMSTFQERVNTYISGKGSDADPPPAPGTIPPIWPHLKSPRPSLPSLLLPAALETCPFQALPRVLMLAFLLGPAPLQRSLRPHWWFYLSNMYCPPHVLTEILVKMYKKSESTDR